MQDFLADLIPTIRADCVLTSIWDCRWWSIADRHNLRKLIEFGAAVTAHTQAKGVAAALVECHEVGVREQVPALHISVNTCA